MKEGVWTNPLSLIHHSSCKHTGPVPHTSVLCTRLDTSRQPKGIHFQPCKPSRFLQSKQSREDTSSHVTITPYKQNLLFVLMYTYVSDNPCKANYVIAVQQTIQNQLPLFLVTVCLFIELYNAQVVFSYT